MEAIGFATSEDGEFFVAELGIGGVPGGGRPAAVAEVLRRATDEIRADVVERDAAKAHTMQRLAEKRQRRKEQGERWSHSWAGIAGRVGGGLGGVVQSQPRHSSGWVGLSNQGATCYLNSLLQCLYHNALLRRMLWTFDPGEREGAGPGAAAELQQQLQPPADPAPSSKFLSSQLAVGNRPRKPAGGASSIPEALQQLFHRMAHDACTVDTKVLTDAFGWSSADAAVQQDAHEALLLLLDAVESCMAQGAASLFTGLMTFRVEYSVRFTSASDAAEHSSLSVEPNRILSLDLVQGAVGGAAANAQGRVPATVSGALEALTAAEVMEGANAYDAGAEHGGLQARALRQCRLVGGSLPPVLFVQLNRFTLERHKDNTRLEVGTTLDLQPFATAPTAQEPAPPTYVYALSAVLVHSGTTAFGHCARQCWFLFAFCELHLRVAPDRYCRAQIGLTSSANVYRGRRRRQRRGRSRAMMIAAGWSSTIRTWVRSRSRRSSRQRPAGEVAARAPICWCIRARISSRR